jgi:antitoxin component YwqK of YwqJK toxin-antitoxin module
VINLTSKLLSPLLVIVFLVGCETETPVISGTSLVIRDGVSFSVKTNKPFTGLAEWYYGNGQLRTFINYVDGKRNGLNEDYYEDGQLAERSTYVDGKRNGLHEEFYGNGRLMERRHYVYGKGNGLWEWFREDGSLDSSKYYENGKVRDF